MGGTLFKTLLVTSSFPRHARDAAGAFLVPLCHALQAHAGPVTVLAPHHGGPLEDHVDGIPVRRFRYAPATLEKVFYGAGALVNLRRSALATPTAVGSMAAHVRWHARSADVVFAHWLVPAGLVSVGLPRVLYAHGSDVRLLARMPGGAVLARRIADGAASIVVPSESLAMELTALLGKRARITVLPLPVAEFHHGSTPTHDVGFLGRLVEQKGVADLLHAAHRAELSVLIAGDGPQRAELEALARRLGVNARFLGAIAPLERAEFLGAVRVVCVPSRLPEGAPAVIAEAFAAGVPVIGTRVAGITDLLLPEATTDADGLSALLQRACSDAGFQSGLKEHGAREAAGRRASVLGPRYREALAAAARR